MKKCMIAVAVLMCCGQAIAESSDCGSWYVSPGVGVMFMNTHSRGDVRDKTPVYMSLGVGYNFPDSPFGLEVGGLFAMHFNASSHSGLNQLGGAYIDGSYHFNRYGRVDPYITLGIGGFWGDEGKPFPSDTQGVMTGRAGAGVLFHMTDNLALRANGSFNLILSDPSQSFETVDLGLVYSFGGGKCSSNRECLSSTGPADAGAAAYNQNLGKQYAGTLTDTTPADSLDTMKLELRVNYDRDVSIIKPEYYPALDEIVRVIKKAMAQNPNVTVSVEGHADQTHGSKLAHNQKLSEDRANAVQDYLISNGIPVAKINAVGYGYSRPKVAPNLDTGNPENRRTEIFINGVGGTANRDTLRSK